MNQQRVVELMKSSKSEIEWNANCDKVKKAFGGNYPDFWYEAIVQPRIPQSTAAKWGDSGNITVTGI